MHPDKTAIERAFELARSGACGTVSELIVRLDREGYDARQIHGRVLRKQLLDLVKEAKASDRVATSTRRVGKQAVPL